MRLIPGKTKVRIELFKGVTLTDVIVGAVGIGVVSLCAISSLPGRWIITTVLASIFVLLLIRIDDEPLYVFVWHMIRYKAYPRRYNRLYDDKALLLSSNPELAKEIFEEQEEKAEDGEETLSPREEKKRLKELVRQENAILKSKTATNDEKDAVWEARARRNALKKKEKQEAKEEEAAFEDIEDIMPFTDIKDGFIEYDGKYYGAVIEIDPVEFRFFSRHRRDNAIEACFGKVLRSMKSTYGANIVKLQRPIIYDKYLDAEYDKLEALKRSYRSGLLSEEELQARVEIQYDRINEVRRLCEEDKVIEPFYYLVLFEENKRRLDVVIRQAMMELERGELVVRRLDTRGLALFLKYSNYLDFDEKEVDDISPENLAKWAMPQDLKFSMRRIAVNGIVTHNMRVISYPTTVGDAWMAGVMSFPGTKVVVKITPMDSQKSIRAIDHSLMELRGQYMNTSVDSKMLELKEHINTLSALLMTLKQDNETLLSVNIYVTAYDAVVTRDDPIYGETFKNSVLPFVADMKRTVKRSYSEAGMKLGGMDFLQTQAFIGSQISTYDPMLKEARGIPSNTIAGMYPWIFAHISDQGGVKLGSADGVPVFIDFFRRDSERVNSNMVIVGKSGSGKSYATKSLLANLASEDSKIFILDPENEYSELARNLHGKVINVGNAKYGRLNPFHIITALDDDEAGEDGGGPGGSFATHLQFLEEFFRQILPDIDKDALEYLNSLVERVYLNFGITPETDLSGFTAEDYPIFDDLYDVVLAEFERTNNEYLRQLLRSLVNYIAKFSTGGRNANIWNGPSTITTDENFSVFNFQSMLANRNTTIANAQMLLVLKYIDNEIIKNRDYNLKYGLNRKIVVVIDEAHVFIDTKFPVALDFMFQLAKRIRKYNGMQIVITQNIKDFVGSEDIARKSSAIINACQYSFVFGLAPNDMEDLCKLYAKAGGINEREQEDILGAKRGQVFTIMSPTSRSSFMIEVPDSMVDMFQNPEFESNYFSGEDGAETWEEFVSEGRAAHDANYAELKRQDVAAPKEEHRNTITFLEISEDEAAELASTRLAEMDSQPRSAMEKLMEAEEAVDRRDYETAAGRFGGISFSEESDDTYDQGQVYGGIRFQEESYGDDDGDTGYGETGFSEEPGESYGKGTGFSGENVGRYDEWQSGRGEGAAGSAGMATPERTSVGGASGQAYIDETLTQFKQSMREEMQKELEDKLKWISLGAAAAGAAVQGAAYTAQAGVQMTGGSGLGKIAVKEPAGNGTDNHGYGEEDVGTGLFMEEDLAYDLDETGYGSDEDESEEQGYGSDEDGFEEHGYGSEEDEFEEHGYEGDEDFYSSGEETYGSDEDGYDEDGMGEDDYGDEEEDDSDEDGFDFGDDEEEDDFDFDDAEDFYSEDEEEEYEPAPFIFAELLAEAAEEYANMGIEERMEEMGESVLAVTLEELAEYVRANRKKK